FLSTPISQIKVVIIGMDPYFKKIGDKIIADGLAFSCSNTQKLQPSLEILYNGMEDDLNNGMCLEMDRNPDLSYLAKQGVLLLNSSLTVLENTPGSHITLWKPFISKVLDIINKYCENV